MRALQKPIEISEVLLKRMNLPHACYGASMEAISEAVRANFAKFIANIVEATLNRVCLYICGEAGVGKTSAAAIVAKATRSWGFSTYFTTISDLRDAVRFSKLYEFDSDGEQTIESRCRTVDVLILDDLTIPDAENKLYGAEQLRGLISTRIHAGLVTHVTSKKGPHDWLAYSPGLQDFFSTKFLPIEIKGAKRNGLGAQKKFLY